MGFLNDHDEALWSIFDNFIGFNVAAPDALRKDVLQLWYFKALL
jgi:hypothetical protein